MIKLTLFNTLTVELFNCKYLFRTIFDTSRSKISFDLKLGLFYTISPWYNNFVETDIDHNKLNRVIDIVCPLLLDLRMYIEQ